MMKEKMNRLVFSKQSFGKAKALEQTPELGFTFGRVDNAKLPKILKL